MMHETILARIRCLGYAVSEFRLPSSLLGTVPACVEMHAVNVCADPLVQHIVKVIDTGPEAEYQCACELARMVGIVLEDG